ncbi:MAG: twin-arginine translocase subunit TatC [Candidatus Omnitrophota bacterium]|nr:twin-arginine translocase subunit TatC [Candidatus Omnitrophota bacterium]MDZ4243149.1 twin-arginine translocase subunit TatC [Candidatus Omnitrophota bacterium]
MAGAPFHSSSPGGSQSFFDHLEELRARIIKASLAFIIGVIFAYPLTDPVLEFVIRPVGHLVFTSPEEAFTARLTMCFLGGFFLSLPVLLYQIWKFVALGLTAPERKFVSVFGPLSFVFFAAGAVFAWFVLIPMSLQFLMGFASSRMQAMITVEKYISYVGTLLIGCGIVFELPLALAFLARIGIATPEFLRQKRRYAIVLILIVSAVVTPPDVISQLLMSLPLVALYEVGILMTQFPARKTPV